MISGVIHQMGLVLSMVYVTIGGTLVLASAIVWLSNAFNRRDVRR
jgi:hypothetical protein